MALYKYCILLLFYYYFIIEIKLNIVLGKLEEHNPFMSFRFPPSFARTHPEAMKNLRTNAHRLTTPFDIHATFEDIVDYKGIMRGDVAKVSSMNETRA